MRVVGVLILVVVMVCGQQYGDPPYDNNNNNQQFGNNPQYGNDRQYDRNRPYDGDRRYDSDRRNDGGRPYDPSRPYDGNRQYDSNNNSQYGNNRQYDNNNPQYGSNRQYDNNSQYGGNNQNYGTNRQYDNNQQYNGQNNNQQFSDNNRQFGNNPQFGNGGQYGNTQYDTQQYGSSNSQDGCCDEYCYTADPDPYIQFASKTAYDTLDKRNGLQHNVPDCTPIQFWSLNRHGTRLPGRRRIDSLRNLLRIRDEIIKNHEQRRSYPDKGRLCPRDYDLIKRWQWNDTVNDAKANSLTSEGINELKLLAARWKAKYPQILNEPYSERAYYFQYTDTDRTHDSYQAFIEGLFGSDAYRVHANTFLDDRLIKTYKNCNAWENQVDNNPMTYSEHKAFTQRREYTEMVHNIFRRLGFRYTLNASIIDDMYDMCRYEKAWNVQRSSPWCVAFNKEQLKMLEYGEDLMSFYKEGYGNELNRKVGCPPLKDWYERFQKTVNGESDGNKATFLFTHSQTIASTLTAMGIARDNLPLKADNYYQQSRRHWRESQITPFAANLVAVLYQCRSSERYKVMFFLNEQPVEFPECQVGLCSWDTIVQKYRDTVDRCNVNFCDGNSATKIYSSYMSYVALAIGYMLFARL